MLDPNFRNEKKILNESECNALIGYSNASIYDVLKSLLHFAGMEILLI